MKTFSEIIKFPNLKSLYHVYLNVTNNFITFILIQEMGKIIQRDFFPDLAKLKAQNEYLDAIATNDVIKLRQIFNKYSKRRPALSKC